MTDLDGARAAHDKALGAYYAMCHPFHEASLHLGWVRDDLDAASAALNLALRAAPTPSGDPMTADLEMVHAVHSKALGAYYAARDAYNAASLNLGRVRTDLDATRTTLAAARAAARAI